MMARRSYHAQSPRGAVLLVALVCLGVAALLGVQVLRVALARKAQLEHDQRQIQTDWLIESGIARAAARLAADHDYTGETWSISGNELGGRNGATVHIRVGPGDAAHQRIQVEAVYPAEGPHRVRQTKQVAGPQKETKT